MSRHRRTGRRDDRPPWFPPGSRSGRSGSRSRSCARFRRPRFAKLIAKCVLPTPGGLRKATFSCRCRKPSSCGASICSRLIEGWKAKAKPANVRTYGSRLERLSANKAFPQGYFGRERPSQARARQCTSACPHSADPGGKKGGSLPSTSEIPDRHGGPGNRAVTVKGTAG